MGQDSDVFFHGTEPSVQTKYTVCGRVAPLQAVYRIDIVAWHQVRSDRKLETKRISASPSNNNAILTDDLTIVLAKPRCLDIVVASSQALRR